MITQRPRVKGDICLIQALQGDKPVSAWWLVLNIKKSIR